MISLDRTVILFYIVLYMLLTRFLLSALFFSSYFKLHNLTHLRADVSTDDHTTADGFALSYLQSSIFNLQQHLPYLSNISRHPINQYHFTHYHDLTMLHPTQPRLIRNSNFPRFATVRQNWCNTTPKNFSPVASKVNPASKLTYHLTP